MLAEEPRFMRNVKGSMITGDRCVSGMNTNGRSLGENVRVVDEKEKSGKQYYFPSILHYFIKSPLKASAAGSVKSFSVWLL